MTRWGTLILLLLLTCLLVGCGSKTRTITLQMSNMRFAREEIRVRAGEDVHLRLVNKDGFAHAFDMDDFDIHVELAGNETVDVTFTPTEAGNFAFYCGAPGHTAAGMTGTLVVTP